MLNTGDVVFFIFVISVVLFYVYWSQITSSVQPYIFAIIAYITSLWNSGFNGGYSEPNYSEDEDNVDQDYEFITAFAKSGGDQDAKNITNSKLKIAAKKSASMEAFVDTLIDNATICMGSLLIQPTDIAMRLLNEYKIIAGNAIDIMEKKYKDSNNLDILKSTKSQIIDAIKDINDKVKLGTVTITKYGDVSKEQLAKMYLSSVKGTPLSSQSTESLKNLENCKLDLRLCEDKRSQASRDNELLRSSNEKLRDEIRRGLSSYTTETLLRDCREENERLKRTKPTDDREIRELREIAKMLQDEVNKCDKLKSEYQSKIEELQRELTETQSVLNDTLNDALNV